MARVRPFPGWDDGMRQELAEAVAGGQGGLVEHFLLRWPVAGVYGALVLSLSAPVVLLGLSEGRAGVGLFGGLGLPALAVAGWVLAVRRRARREGRYWAAELLLRERGVPRARRREVLEVLRAACGGRRPLPPDARPSAAELARVLAAATREPDAG